jgi:hypothetical protein
VLLVALFACMVSATANLLAFKTLARDVFPVAERNMSITVQFFNMGDV